MTPESFFDENSRVNKFDKRRKNTKLMNSLIVLAVLLGLFLAFMFIFNEDEQPVAGNEEPKEEQTDSQQEQGTNEEVTETPEEGNSQEKENESTNEQEQVEHTEATDPETNDNESGEDLEGTTSTEESNDPNVLETIVKDWQPIGTVQEEPHTTQIDDSTVDWDEMLQAAHYATGLQQDNSIIWWVTSGGSPDTVEITLTDKAQTVNYRVYLQWVTNEGWKPTKVEKLKENDKKALFEDDESSDTESETQAEGETEQQESGE